MGKKFLKVNESEYAEINSVQLKNIKAYFAIRVMKIPSYL